MSVATMIAEDMNTNEYWAWAAKFEFVVALNKVMIEKNITRSDLARLIGKSPAYITKVMSGDTNLTIESMVMFSRSVGMRFLPAIQPERPVGRQIAIPTINYHTKQDETLVKAYARR